MDAGREPRPGEDLQPDRPPELPEARAGVRLGGLARCRRPRRPARRRRAVVSSASRATSRLVGAAHPRRRCRPGRPTLRPACSARYAPVPEQGLRRRRASPSPARCCAAATAEPAALVPRRAAGRRSARREPGPALRRALLPAGAQGADGEAGRQPDEGLPAKHRHARLDEPGDEAGGASPSSTMFAPKIGYPKRWRDYSALVDRRRRPGRQRRARAASSSTARDLRQARQAGRPRRVAHDPADASTPTTTRRSTRSSSRPASCSRRSSTPRPTTPSTTARSARSSATRSATASTTRAASTTPTATCATGGPPADRERFEAQDRGAGRAVLGVRAGARLQRSTASSRWARTSPTTPGLEIAYKAYQLLARRQAGARRSTA